LLIKVIFVLFIDKIFSEGLTGIFGAFLKEGIKNKILLHVGRPISGVNQTK